MANAREHHFWTQVCNVALRDYPKNKETYLQNIVLHSFILSYIILYYIILYVLHYSFYLSYAMLSLSRSQPVSYTLAGGVCFGFLAILKRRASTTP